MSCNCLTIFSSPGQTSDLIMLHIFLAISASPRNFNPTIKPLEPFHTPAYQSCLTNALEPLTALTVRHIYLTILTLPEHINLTIKPHHATHLPYYSCIITHPLSYFLTITHLHSHIYLAIHQVTVQDTSSLATHLHGDPKRCVPMKMSIVTLIKKLFILNYNQILFS